MNEHFFRTEILLASKSPRRIHLLHESGFKVNRVSIDVEENFDENLRAAEIPIYLAEKKSKAFQGQIEPQQVLVTADTVVWIQDKVLNKPETKKEAKVMLQMISGNTHTVYTAVCMRNAVQTHTFSVASDVEFYPLSEKMIDFYLDKYSPMDKAGAYGIQEFIGYLGIKKINGCYYNVMGFPVSAFVLELENFLS